MATAGKQATISKAQFKRLCEDVAKDAPAILKARDKSDKAMDKTSALLRALLVKLREQLGLPSAGVAPTTRGFKTYEFSYREAIYELALERAKEPFDYQKIMDGFLAGAAK